jgi:hypothetical protein
MDVSHEPWHFFAFYKIGINGKNVVNYWLLFAGQIFGA